MRQECVCSSSGNGAAAQVHVMPKDSNSALLIGSTSQNVSFSSSSHGMESVCISCLPLALTITPLPVFSSIA
nr:MAG TPA: hypothetical protein [Caudoviricetes sp.]